LHTPRGVPILLADCWQGVTSNRVLDFDQGFETRHDSVFRFFRIFPPFNTLHFHKS